MRRVCGFARFRRCTEVVVRKASEVVEVKLGIVGCGEVDGGTQRKDAALGGEEESAADLMRNAAYR